MATVRKFMFDRSFDDIDLAEPPTEAEETEADEEPEEPEEEVPTFSEEDVARAREEGFVSGREQGVAEATEATERRIAETLDIVVGHLETLLADRQRAAEQASRDAMTAGIAIVRKLFSALAGRQGLGEVEGVIAEAMERSAEEPHLEVRVNEALRDQLSEQIAAVAESRHFAGGVDVVADAAVAEGDCVVEWTSGAAVRNADRLWNDIDAIVEHNLGPEATQQSDQAAEPPAGLTGTDDDEGQPQSRAADEDARRGDADG